MPNSSPVRAARRAGLNKPLGGAALNPDHPHGDAADYWLFNEFSGGFVRNLSQRSGGLPLISSVASWVPGGPYGGGLAVGVGAQTCVSSFSLTVAAQTSLVYIFAQTAAEATNGLLLALRQTGTANNQLCLQYDSGSPPLNLNVNIGSTVAAAATQLQIAKTNIPGTTNSLYTSPWGIILATFDRATGTINAWVNGVAFTQSGSAVTANTASFALTVGAGATGSGPQGSTAAVVARYNRLLTAQDAALLLAEPFAPVIVRSPRRYWVVSAGGTLFTASLSGGITPSGTLAKKDAKSLSGSSASSGTLSRSDSKALAGAVASGGVAVKQDAKSLSGSAASSGTLVRTDGKSLSGSAATSGSLSRSDSKSLAGSATASGSLARADAKNLSGSISPSGAPTLSSGKGLSGSAGSSGSVVRATTTSLSGTIPPTGSVSRLGTRSLSGTVTPTGSLSALQVVGRFLGGTIASSGTIVRTAVIHVSGTIAQSGSITRASSRSSSGQVTPSGTAARSLARFLSFASSTGVSGDVSRFVQKVLQGIVSSAGFVSTGGRFLFASLAGTVASKGWVVRRKNNQSRKIAASTSSPVDLTATATGGVELQGTASEEE